jgi:hypothetical protein
MKNEMRNKKAPNDTNTTFVKFQTYADSCVVLPLHIPQQAVPRARPPQPAPPRAGAPFRPEGRAPVAGFGPARLHCVTGPEESRNGRMECNRQKWQDGM